MHPIRLTCFFAAFLSCSAAQSDVTPGPESVPEWAQQGKFRFTRFDGGPLQVCKTTRSDWGKHFNEQQKEVLANLYSKYGDRMADLLAEANINWVWITWSVGFSEAEEAEQRAQCKIITEKLHQRGIRAAAYMCAVSVFWETMFRDHPRAVRWLRFDPQGTPFRYSGGKDALRFIADVSNPEWLEYQKQRVGGIIDAGLDGIFFDNTACPGWNTREALDGHFAALRRYIHEEKKSNILLFTNYGLRLEGITLNDNMEFVFNEGWREPGAWGDDWEVSNVRRMRYVRGVLPEWKAAHQRVLDFPQGQPRHHVAGAALAEARHSGSGRASGRPTRWDMEGPFDGALMAGDASALACVESHRRSQRIPQTQRSAVRRCAERDAGGRAAVAHRARRLGWWIHLEQGRHAVLRFALEEERAVQNPHARRGERRRSSANIAAWWCRVRPCCRRRTKPCSNDTRAAVAKCWCWRRRFRWKPSQRSGQLAGRRRVDRSGGRAARAARH